MLTKMRYISVLCVLISTIFKIISNDNVAEDVAKGEMCQSYDKCDSCIESEVYCSWCFDENYEGGRCGVKETLLQNGCKHEHIIAGEDIASEIINSENDSNKNFSDVTRPDNLEESVQIKPQKITIKLSRKKPLNVKFKYRLAKNYPLDLYYLMDLTKTMENDVTAMTTLGKELTDVLQNLTRHFRVAFGYYSDKVEMPFSKMTKEFIKNPCIDSGTVCVKGFDFVHSLNFTNDVDEFIEKIKTSKTTANLDNLEGGLDALYQVILCQEQIQWRQNSRRIVVIATDGILHSAGDGILAGAVKRNIDRCLLDAKGIYQKSLIYDYPSLEEMYNKLLNHKINVIFAAKEDSIDYYKKLNKVIGAVSYVGTLAENSTNVIDLVKEGYLNVVKNVEFIPSKNKNLNISWVTSNKLNNVEEGKEYNFSFDIQLLQIPNNVNKETIIIEERNIAEKLFIEIQYKGRCNCKDNHHNNIKCSNHGTYSCGVCECEEGWKGKTCNQNCMDQNFEECREKNITYTSSTCHGRGDCSCGKCICDEEYTGKYCEKKQCLKSKDGKVCGGPNHGLCLNEKCQCASTYIGGDCSCTKSTNNCEAPGANSICNAAGKCECGKCICNPKYSGKYCEICDTCQGLCETYENCTLDSLYNVTNSDNCVLNDGAILMPKIVTEPIPEDPTVCKLVQTTDEKTCYIRYKYIITKGYVELHIHSECSEKVKAAVTVGIIIAVILGAGIIVIFIWKAKLKIDERKEFAEFNKNLENTRMLDENPLYNSPIRTYKMPSFTSSL